MSLAQILPEREHSLSLGGPLKLEKHTLRPTCRPNRARGRDPVRAGPAQSQYQGSRVRTKYMLGQSSEIYDQGPGSRESSP